MRSTKRLALRSDGALVAWGNNWYGQNIVPALPTGLSYVEADAGIGYSAARRSDGTAVVWGMAVIATNTVPALPTGVTYTELATGSSHMAALRSDGTIVAWGASSFGETSVPPLPAGTSYVEVDCGYNHTVARRSDGAILAWGNNGSSQTIVPPTGIGERIVALSAGWYSNALQYEFQPSERYCMAKLNSIGCLPTIASSGWPSATIGSGFTIYVANVRNSKVGLFLYGINGRIQVPFQGGTLCVAPPIKRTAQINSGGAPLPTADCSGLYTLDFNAFAVGALGGSPHAALQTPGSVIDVQAWGRDPGFSAPNNTTLSDGLEYYVLP
jgi:hypothetical protein